MHAEKINNTTKSNKENTTTEGVTAVVSSQKIRKKDWKKKV
jgi:hypothetical protein